MRPEISCCSDAILNSAIMTKNQIEKTRKDNIRAHFEKFSNSRDHWISRNRDYHADDRRYVRFVIPEGMRVLELGCGTGDLLAQLKLNVLLRPRRQYHYHPPFLDRFGVE